LVPPSGLARRLSSGLTPESAANPRLDTASPTGLFLRRLMNLDGTTLVSPPAHLSVVAVSVVSVSVAVMRAPRGF
jgi:hypothetical protein